MASTRISAISPTNLPRTNYRGSARSVLAHDPRTPHRADRTHQRTLDSHGWKKSRPAKPTWSIRWPALHAAGVQRPRRVMGFCYGGPYAILGPKRLGYAAGILCHGTRMLDYIGDSTASPRRSASSGATRTTGRRRRCSMPIARCRAHEECRGAHFPGVLHGYMMPDAGEAFSRRRAISRWGARSRSSTDCSAAARGCARRLKRAEVPPTAGNLRPDGFGAAI